jgi:hypothetical protein
MREANAQGISEITLRRAKKAIGVRSFQFGGAWYCTLNKDNQPGAHQDSDAHSPMVSV